MLTLEDTIEKVKELNKELKEQRQLLHTILEQIARTYSYIGRVADILDKAKVSKEKKW